jgi:uncharacterized membrane protein YbhN (UPF0104 family)/tRNA A-37 threonylcarbamoyl transferase component Bud32
VHRPSPTGGVGGAALTDVVTPDRLTAPAHTLARFERFLFASSGTEPRRRRVVDALLLGAGVLAGWIGGVIARGPRTGEAAVSEGLGRAFGWLDPLWSVSYGAVSALCIAFLVVAAIAGRRALTRDISATVVACLLVNIFLSRAIVGEWPAPGDILWREGAPSYPAIRLALAIALVVVLAPDLTRPARRLSSAIVGLGAWGALVLGVAYPADVLGGLAIGVAIGATIRLVFGSTAGFPSEARVEAALAHLGVDVVALDRADRQREGVASYVARDASRSFRIKMYGRDARDTQLLARLWRLLWYRNARIQVSFTRLQLVEHEALMLYAAAEAGVSVPRVVAVGTTPSRDAVLVTEQPHELTIADADPHLLTDALLHSLFAQAARMRAAGIRHGRLNADSIVLVDGVPVVMEFQGASLSASPEAMGSDLAELLVSCALITGNQRAVDAALAALGVDVLSGAVPYLQSAALTPALRGVMQHAHFDLKELHELTAAATATEVAEIAQLRRISLRRIVLTALIAIAAFSIVAMIEQIGVRELLDVLSEAKLGWVFAAIILAEMTLVADALSMQAAVSTAIPLGPTTLLESAIKLVNLSTPASAGKIALNIRYLQKQGSDAAIAVTQGALDGLAGFVVQALILVLLLPTVDFHFDSSGDADHSGIVTVLAIVVAGAAIGLVIGALLPRVRKRVMPYIAAGRDDVRMVMSSPRRASQLLGANFVSQLLFALCLGASLRAYGQHLPIATLLVVNTGVTLFSGVMPVPGGVGVAEAALTAGLIAVGVPSDIAVAAAITHRIASAYLPPVPGAFALEWLGKHGYV